jgi:hypothetical protein
MTRYNVAHLLKLKFLLTCNKWETAHQAKPVATGCASTLLQTLKTAARAAMHATALKCVLRARAFALIQAHQTCAVALALVLTAQTRKLA